MPLAAGTIVVAQEGRFRLVTADGQARMFILAHDAAVEPQDLLALQRAQSRVRVLYHEAPSALAGVATAIVVDHDVPPRGRA